MVQNLFDVLFDNDFYGFSRMVRDKRPYQIVKNEGATIIIHNVTGIDEKDISVKIRAVDDRNSYVEITGETKDDYITEEAYSIKSRFTIKHNDVEKITKKTKNGILYLTIKWKEQEKPNIIIEDE